MNHLNECVVGLAGLTALWALWYFFLKEQRVDRYREELFALRDELFDMAACGELKFHHRAYCELRLHLNGMLRFAHRANLVGLIIAVLRSRLREDAPSGFAKWERALQELPDPTQSKLRNLHKRMIKLFMVHLFTGSITLMVFFGPALVFGLFRALCRRLLGFPWALLNFERGFDGAMARVAYQARAQTFEVDAYFSERDAQSRMEELQAV